MAEALFWLRARRHVRRHPQLRRVLIHLRTRAGHLWLRLFRWLLPERLDFGPPKGWFWIAEKIVSGEVRGRIILEKQSANKPQASELRRQAQLGQDQQINWPIFWSYHHEVELVGPSLLLQDSHRRIGVESAYGPNSIEDDPGYRQFRRPSAVRLNGPWTNVVSRWSEGFCHWFVDVLPRLALLQELPPETRVIIPPVLTHFRRDTLEWMGLSGRVRPTSEQHLSVEHFYFSSPTNVTGLFDPYAVEFLRRTFLGRRDVNYDSPKKFFIHRVGAVRGLVNEGEVIEFFQKRGWPIVDTEKLTLAQQIQLFTRAEQVCALHGAALTNLLWSRPVCRALELIPTTYMNGVYEGIAEAVGIDYEFLLCPGDAEFKARVDLAELDRRLSK